MPAASAEPVLFGVLNVTPDSFSDGGLHLEPEAAVAFGLRLVAAGADVVDVGGESTRPGAEPVDPAEELRRVLPVVRGLSRRGVQISIDTRRASVAAAAIDAGASIVNDVDGGDGDPEMLAVVAAADVDYVVMHSRGPAAADGGYDDVVADVARELVRRVRVAVRAGVAEDRLIADPGIGFAKTAEENWRLLAHLDDVRVDGLRLLVGASRKRFLGALLDRVHAPEERDAVTAVLSARIADRVWGLRVHDPAATRAAIAVERHMREAA